MAVTVDVSQLFNFAGRALRAIPAINSAIEQVVADTATAVQEQARSNAPERTGTLKASIEKEVDGTHARVFTDLRYAPFVEFGTYKDPTQPFLLPAADAQERPFPVKLGRVVVAVTRRALG